MAERPYTLIKPRTSDLGRRYSLWFAEDHLLKLTNTGYAEEYRRFFFKDIQAITFTRTSVRMAINIAALALQALLMLIIFAAAGVGQASLVAVLVLGLLPAIIIVINSALGPTCKCEIRTAVQTEKLPTIRRTRAAWRLLSKVQPLIMEAQAELAAKAAAQPAAQSGAAPRTTQEFPPADAAPPSEATPIPGAMAWAEPAPAPPEPDTPPPDPWEA